MEKKKKFKIVFVPENNTYELWITDHKGDWGLSYMFSTFANNGDIIDSECSHWCMVSEQILWEMDKLNFLGYEFIGIEKNQNQ